MKSRNVLFVFLYLFVNVTMAHKTSDFSGFWCWDKNSKKNTFSLEIKRTAESSYLGRYDSVSSCGNKIDDNDNAFNFKTKGKLTKIKIISGITGNVGLARIKISNDNNMLKWRVLKRPKGEFYPPDFAVMHRCK